MKKRMKVLALMTAMTLTFSSIPVNAAPQNDTSYSSVLSLKNWWGDFWDKVTGKGDNAAMRNKIFYFYLILHHLRILLFIHISPKFLKVIHLT